MLITTVGIVTLMAVSIVLIVLCISILVVAPHLIVCCDVHLVHKRCLVRIESDSHIQVVESYHW